MALDEEARLGLCEALKEVIGVDNATTFMEHLPYGGWQSLATKDDIAQLRREFCQLRREFSQLRADTKNDIAALEERLDLRFEAKLHRELNALHRNLFISLAGLQTAFAGVIIALG